MLMTTWIRLTLHLLHNTSPRDPLENRQSEPRRQQQQLLRQEKKKPRSSRELDLLLPTIYVNGDDRSPALAVPSHLDEESTTDDPPLPSDLLVTPHDFIYKLNLEQWDSAPIVIESHKLIFFTIPKVACTTFKQLFRRMNHLQDWDSQDPIRLLPHNPHTNGLVYLWDYPLVQANRIMTSPDYTRAIFVRDPKSRFLSAFLDKGVGNFEGFIASKCCRLTQDCADSAKTSVGFLELIRNCSDPHWDPQSQRMEAKFWPYINFVGHFEHLSRDGPALLKKIGAWEEFGYGWGRDGNATLFSSSSKQQQTHSTGSSEKVWQWLTPSLERKIETYYREDYQQPLFEFEIKNLTKNYWIKGFDKIFAPGPWDGAPVVVEKYKLIFFTIPRIGASVWKQAFRRMEGLPDWKSTEHGLPHNPDINGLKYLYHFDAGDAERIIRDPTWTKALFIRHPKDRFLDIVLHMSKHPSEVRNVCCYSAKVAGLCHSNNTESFSFFLDLASKCVHHGQWAPQSSRMEDRYWEYVNFIGRIESAEEDAKKLLERVGAWEDIGSNGWGPNGTEPMFRSSLANDGESTIVSMEDLSLIEYPSDLEDQKLHNLYMSDFEKAVFHFHRSWNTSASPLPK